MNKRLIIVLVLLESIHSIHGMGLHKRALDEPITYSSMIDFDEVMAHLNALENIAKSSNGNRAVQNIGFNRSVDYIFDYLRANSNLQVQKSYFVWRNYRKTQNPTFSSVINGVVKNHLYSTTLSQAEFYEVQYSTSIQLTSNTRITAIPNLGCTDEDYLNASPSPSGIVALVKRGDCSFEEKARLASRYNVAALLIYNDGTAPDRFQPISINLGQNNLLPALFLSYNLGQTLLAAINDPAQTVSVRLTISTDTAIYSVANICADTPTGDPTQTIVIGSHSDSVQAGPGINDNGSGSAANLVLATTLARLFQSPTYPLYKYRVRFCWWGAEEVGLIGSKYHVTQAKNSSIVGERLSDYLININLDMIGSPNFIFGIYNGASAPTSTPAKAKPGSLKVTTLFQTWFDQNKLPWDNTNFDGRSDYGPFLAEGVVCGGLFTGADGTKTVAQRTRYESMLGSGLGGLAEYRLDQCYHKACDDTKNINKFALEKMVRASAAAIEKLAREADLKTWLYPTKDIEILSKYAEPRKYPYNSINEYFGLAYD